MNDDDMDIFDLARQVLENDRAISSFRAWRLAAFVLGHEPKTDAELPAVEPTTYEDEGPDEPPTYPDEQEGSDE